MLETVLGILVGVGVAAACGSRVVVPLFALGAASRAEHVTLSPSFAALGSTPALVAPVVTSVLAILVPPVACALLLLMASTWMLRRTRRLGLGPRTRRAAADSGLPEAGQ